MTSKTSKTPAAEFIFTLTLTAEDVAKVTAITEAAIACGYDGADEDEDLASAVDEDGNVDPVAALNWFHRNTHHAVSRPAALVRDAAKYAAAKGVIPSADFLRWFPEEPTRDGGKGKRTSAAAAKRAAIPVEVKPEAPAAPVAPKRTRKAAPVKVDAPAAIAAPPPPPPVEVKPEPVKAPKAPKAPKARTVKAPAPAAPAREVTAPAAPAIAADPLAGLTPEQVRGLLAQLATMTAK